MLSSAKLWRSFSSRQNKSFINILKRIGPIGLTPVECLILLAEINFEFLTFLLTVYDLSDKQEQGNSSCSVSFKFSYQ